MRWQIGIASVTSDDVSWQQDWVEAETKSEAEEIADGKGYYRNVRVRTAIAETVNFRDGDVIRIIETEESSK